MGLHSLQLEVIVVTLNTEEAMTRWKMHTEWWRASSAGCGEVLSNKCTFSLSKAPVFVGIPASQSRNPHNGRSIQWQLRRGPSIMKHWVSQDVGIVPHNFIVSNITRAVRHDRGRILWYVSWTSEVAFIFQVRKAKHIPDKVLIQSMFPYLLTLQWVIRPLRAPVRVPFVPGSQLLTFASAEVLIVRCDGKTIYVFLAVMVNHCLWLEALRHAHHKKHSKTCWKQCTCNSYGMPQQSSCIWSIPKTAFQVSSFMNGRCLLKVSFPSPRPR